MEGVMKTSSGYNINGYRVDRFDKLWNHTIDRVESFERKYTDTEEFKKKMLVRLNRIKQVEKIYYTIAVLIERGHEEIAEIYDSKLVLITLADDFEF